MPITIENPRVLTVPEASKYLRGLRSPSWIFQAIRRGEFPASRIGSSYLIATTDLDKYIEKHKTSKPHKRVPKRWVADRWAKYRAAKAAKTGR